ncbi:MAG: hypothetical protein EZS28_034965, partial [Streblomastix strix]
DLKDKEFKQIHKSTPDIPNQTKILKQRNQSKSKSPSKQSDKLSQTSKTPSNRSIDSSSQSSADRDYQQTQTYNQSPYPPAKWRPKVSKTYSSPIIHTSPQKPPPLPHDPWKPSRTVVHSIQLDDQKAEEIRNRILAVSTPEKFAVALNSMDTTAKGTLTDTEFNHALQSCGVYLNRDLAEYAHEIGDVNAGKTTTTDSQTSDKAADSKINYTHFLEVLALEHPAAFPKGNEVDYGTEPSISPQKRLSTSNYKVRPQSASASTTTRTYTGQENQTSNGVNECLHPMQNPSTNNNQYITHPVRNFGYSKYKQHVSLDLIAHSDVDLDVKDPNKMSTIRVIPQENHGNIIARGGIISTDTEQRKRKAEYDSDKMFAGSGARESLLQSRKTVTEQGETTQDRQYVNKVSQRGIPVSSHLQKSDQMWETIGYQRAYPRSEESAQTERVKKERKSTEITTTTNYQQSSKRHNYDVLQSHGKNEQISNKTPLGTRDVVAQRDNKTTSSSQLQVSEGQQQYQEPQRQQYQEPQRQQYQEPQRQQYQEQQRLQYHETERQQYRGSDGGQYREQERQQYRGSDGGQYREQERQYYHVEQAQPIQPRYRPQSATARLETRNETYETRKVVTQSQVNQSDLAGTSHIRRQAPQSQMFDLLKGGFPKGIETIYQYESRK